jgi:hypothetical protein
MVQGTAIILRRWQKPGDENRTNVPSMIYPNPTSSRDDFYNASDVNVEKEDQLQAPEPALSYTLSERLTRKIGVNQLSVFATADNLNWIIWRANRLKIDPDYPGGFKQAPSISLGIKAAF